MSDPINDLKPGQPMSEEQKKALGEANLAASNEAHKMAADRRAEDAMNEPPLVNALQASIKDKLEALPPLSADQATSPDEVPHA